MQYHEDSNIHVKQALIMNLLGLSDTGKNILTRSIKEVFPNSTKKTIVVRHENVYPFVIMHFVLFFCKQTTSNIILSYCGRNYLM